MVGYISVKKLLKTAIVLVQEPIKEEKELVFGPALTPFLPILAERSGGKFYIMIKVGLDGIKEILKKYVYNRHRPFFNIFLFCLKGYSETLTCFATRYDHDCRLKSVFHLKVLLKIIQHSMRGNSVVLKLHIPVYNLG